MEAMKRLSSMPAFHHDHQSRKKAAAEAGDNKRATTREEESDEEGDDEERSEEEMREERDRPKSLSRSKSFKMKLLQKMRKKNKEGSSSSSKKEETKRKMEREKRKDEMVKTHDKKTQLDSSTTASSSHIREIPQTVMCGMNLPGYKSHIKRSASSSSSPYSAGAAAPTNNRGRQGDRQSHSGNPLLINDEKERRRAEARERHHRELRLGAVLSPSPSPSPSPSAHPPNRGAVSPAASSSSPSGSPSSAAEKKNENEGETAKKREKHRSSFLAQRGAAKRASPPATSAGQGAWIKGTTHAGSGLSTNSSGECDYAERGEEGIDLMELQRQFQQVGAGGGGGAPGMIDEERRVRLAEDRIKGAARLPWWGLNASSGKEGRRKEWERFFSGFKVSELWEDDEGEDDDDDDEDEDPCRGKKVAYLTEETTVKEALDVMSERGLNALPICLKEVEGKVDGAKASAAENGGGGTQEDEVRERALRHLRKWRKAELARERERKQRKQRGKTVLGWIDLRDLLTFAVFKFPRPPSADTGIDEVRRQGVEFTQHKIRELVNIYGTNGAHVVNDEGTGGQGGHRIAANDRMPAVFRMLRSEKGLRVLPVYDQSQLPAESRCLVRVLDTKVVIRWLHRVVQDNRTRSPFVRELANRQVRHWGAFADAILGKELIYFETEEMINNFDHFRARKRERRMSKLILPFGSVEGGSTVEVANHKKNPSPPPTPNDSHSKEKLDLNKHLFTISADRSVIDAFKIIYNYKVSALGVLEKKGKERNVDDNDDESSSESDSYDESSSTSSSSSGEEEERARRKDQEKAKGPSLKEAKAMVEAARDSSSDDESSSESDDSSDSSSDSDDSAESPSEDEPGDNTATTTSTSNLHPSQQSANHQRPASPKRTTDSQALSSHSKPRRSQSDPLGLSASKRANAHDASDTVPAKAKTHHGTATKERKPSGSRGKRTPVRITREEMVVRAAQAGKLISHLSSSDLKNFEPFAMMRCLHMSIKEYLACFKEKKPLVTCRRDTTLLQLLEKMAREEVNRIWLLADEEDDDDEEDENDKGHDRKAKHEPNKPKDNGGRPIGMISLADIIAEVTRL